MYIISCNYYYFYVNYRFLSSTQACSQKVDNLCNMYYLIYVIIMDLKEKKKNVDRTAQYFFFLSFDNMEV